MATNASPFVVNIVDLQNIANSINGTSQQSQLIQAQVDIGNLQQIVDFQTRTVSADIIKSYTVGQPIDVMASLNLSNSFLYSNSNVVSLTSATNTTSTTITNLSTLGTSGTHVTIQSLASTITFTTAGTQSLQLSSNGVASFSSDVYVGGTLYVTGSVQSSDRRLKTQIVPFSTSVDEVLKLEPCSFVWSSSGQADLGFIAQDVQTVWPDLVSVDKNGTAGIAYSRFIPLLLEGLRDLRDRVVTLETHLREKPSTIINESRFESTLGSTPRDEPVRRKSL